MIKPILLLITLLTMTPLLSQQQALRITRPEAKREYIIKENKRVRIRTADGQKVSGRIQFLGADKIVVKGTTYELSDIMSIKRNPLFFSIVTNGLLIYGGMVAAGVGAIIAALSDTTGLLLLIPAAGLIYAAIKAPNFSRNFKTDANWNFEIITLPDRSSQAETAPNRAVVPN